MRALVLLLFAVSVHAGEWGSRGLPRAFAVRGDVVYVADGRGVSAYDVAGDIRRIDVERSDGESRDAAVRGDALFVATARGVEEYAIAGDGTLTRTGALAGEATRIAASERHVATAFANVVRTTGGTLTFPSQVRALELVDELLYVSVGTTIRIFDPATKEEVAQLVVDANAIAHAGNTLWIAGNKGLAVVDATRGEIVARHTTPKLIDIAAGATRAFARDESGNIHVFDANGFVQMLPKSDVIAVAGERLIEGEIGTPVRIRNAGTFVEERAFRDLAGPVSGVWTDGSLAYLVDAPYLRVLDVSRTETPRELGAIEIAGIQPHIRVRGGVAILYGAAHVDFIDINDKLHPRWRGTYDGRGHPPGAAAFIRDLVVEGNAHSGLHLIDFSDPARPAEVATRFWHYLDLATGDDAIYALQPGAFLVLELTPARTFVERTSSLVDGYEQLDTMPPNVSAPKKLVWRNRDGLLFLDLEHDRFEPRELARVALTNAGAFTTTSDSVYIAADGALLRVQPGQPPVDLGVRLAAPMQLSAANGKVVVADRYSLKVFGPDTAPPALPAPPRRRATRH